MTFVEGGDGAGRRRLGASADADVSDADPSGAAFGPGSWPGVSRTVRRGTALIDTWAHERRERRTPAPEGDCRIVACLGLEPESDAATAGLADDVLWRLSARRLQRCIRPEDSMCMIGGNRLVVSFTHGAHRISPMALGTRLARAVADPLAVGEASAELRVSVGIGIAPASFDPEELTRMALSSARAARRHPSSHGAPTARHDPVVAVTRAPRRAELAHRTLVTLAPLADGQIETSRPRPASVGARRPPSGRGACRVLVVDPGAPGGPPRLAVEGVNAMAKRIGVRTLTSMADDPETVLVDLALTEADAVVLTLHADSQCDGNGHGSPWEHGARIARAVAEAGVPVIAVSVGASAASVAACVEHGAIGLFDIEELSHELATLPRNPGPRHAATVVTGTPPGPELARPKRALPPPYDALVQLTSSERKVLYHMMAGRSAGEIATVLVVSLTTVRSHIRSILRKLNVNSQLAAVAIANGAHPEQAVSD